MNVTGRAAPRVVVLANCQSVGLAQSVNLLVPGTRAHPVRIHLIDDSRQDKALDLLDKADLILTQNLSNFGLFNTDQIRAAFPDRTVVIPNIYWRDFHPDACYVGARGSRVPSPIGDYHSVVILDSFLRGHSESACVARFTAEGFGQLGLLPDQVDSMQTVRQRDSALDIRAEPLIDRYRERQQVFMYTINHPRIALLKDIVAAALSLCGVAVQDYDSSQTHDNLMYGPLLAVQPFLSQALGFPVNFPFWKAAGTDGRYVFLDVADFVRDCYAQYRQQDRTLLQVQSPQALQGILPVTAP